MKNIARQLIISFAICFAALSISADDNCRQQMTREQFAETQARHIAAELKLDEAKTTQLVEKYCACQKELWNLRPKRDKKQKATKDDTNGRKKKDLTEEEARTELTNRFSHWRQFNDIQEKYYNEYSKFLSQVQIYRLYELERKQMDNMRTKGKNKPRHK